jgi:hypothetical protein
MNIDSRQLVSGIAPPEAVLKPVAATMLIQSAHLGACG